MTFTNTNLQVYYGKLLKILHLHLSECVFNCKMLAKCMRLPYLFSLSAFLKVTVSADLPEIIN